MTPTLAVLRREFVARRALLSIALAAAVIAWLLPFAPGFGDDNAAEVRSLASFTLALALGWGLAIGLGATTFGSDLSEGRFGFFLARPVSANSVWFGRILAVVLLSLASELIVIVPALFGDGVQVPIFGSFLQWQNLLLFLAAPVLLVLLAHTVSIMLRARTAWLFLDLAGIFAVFVILWWSLGPLFFAGAIRASAAVLGVFVLALVVALAVAGLAGVHFGRSDLRKTHQWLSIVLWVLVGISLAGVRFGAEWLWDFGPMDIAEVEVNSVADNGEWLEISARGEGRLDVWRRFLISTQDDSYFALPHNWMFFLGQAEFSSDSSLALWQFVDANGEFSQMLWVDLSSSRPEVIPSTLVASSNAVTTLSGDGSRCAVLEDGLITVYEIAADRLLTAAQLPPPLRRATLLFESNQSLRIYGRSDDKRGSVLSIARMDVESGEIVGTGEIGGLDETLYLALDVDMEFAVFWSRGNPGSNNVSKIVDAIDGSFIRDFDHGGLPRFLLDGRLVTLSTVENNQSVLIVESVDGSATQRHPLEAGRATRLIGEIVPGAVAVSRHIDPTDPTAGVKIDLVDLQTGAVRTIASPLRGRASRAPWQPGLAGAVFWFAEQPEARRFFVDQEGAVVRWDPESDQLIRVVGGRPG